MDILNYAHIELTNAGLRTLPEIPAVYFLKDVDGEVLYVGRTENLQYRWRYHHLIQRQLSCMDYWRLSLCWYVNVEDIYKLESDLINKWHPAWNCAENTGHYNPTYKLDFVAFCVSCVSCYGKLARNSRSKRKLTYETADREPIQLRKKSYNYGNIPKYLISYEWLLEKLEVHWPISIEELSTFIAASTDNENIKYLHRLQRKIASKENKVVPDLETYVKKPIPPIAQYYINKYKNRKKTRPSQ
jgi:hypothetical protein